MSTDTTADEGLDIGLDTMIADQPGARVQFQVESFGDADAIELVLRTDNHITWWKSLSYFPQMQGSRGYGPEARIETRDSVHEARLLLFLPDLTRNGVIELWKGGFLGFGAFVGSLPIDSFANRGRRLIFTWHED
jgi:hypothetical protein